MCLMKLFLFKSCFLILEFQPSRNMMQCGNFYLVTGRRLFYHHNSKERIVRVEKVAQLWKFSISQQKMMLPIQLSTEVVPFKIVRWSAQWHCVLADEGDMTTWAGLGESLDKLTHYLSTWQISVECYMTFVYACFPKYVLLDPSPDIYFK